MPASERIQQLRQKHADYCGQLRGLSGKALLERKPALVAEIRKLSDAVNDGKRDFTAEEAQRWELVNEHYDLLQAEAEEAQDPRSPRNHRDRLAALSAGERAARPDYQPPGRGDGARGDGASAAGDSDKIRGLALRAWFKAQLGHFVTDEEADACRQVRLNPAAKQLDIPLLATEDRNALRAVFDRVHPGRARAEMDRVQFGANLSQQVGASGAYLTPPETLVRQLETNMLWYGGMRQVAETISTTTGERMSWPTADDTTNTGAQLGENTSIGSSVDPTFGKVFWDAYKFSSKPVLVPYELLQDSAFDLAAWLGEALGTRLGRITNTKYTTGTGAATPKGIMVAASSFSAASASSIGFDDYFGLIHSIDPAYRTGDCRFMMHDNTALATRKLKNGFGGYLWEPGLQLGIPDRILGYGMTINQDMDSSFSSGKKSVLFGQLFKYKIRRAGQMRLYHLVERYRDSDQDAFIAFIREDGNLLTAGTAPVKYLSH